LPTEAPKPEPTPDRAPPAPTPTEPPPAASPLPGAPAKSPSLTHRININSAPQAELELLPSVGPSLAKAIIDYRTLHGPFKAISDLDKVKGIGPKKLAKMAPLVTID
jgi:competence protein ComEA